MSIQTWAIIALFLIVLNEGMGIGYALNGWRSNKPPALAIIGFVLSLIFYGIVISLVFFS